MVSRKGELSPSGVDRGWPHQVALREDFFTGTNFDMHREFNKGLSICSRGHKVSYEGH